MGDRDCLLAVIVLATAVLAGPASGQQADPNQSQAEHERQRAAQMQHAYLARWSDAGNGVLRDSDSGLEWSQHDNDADIHWRNATDHCQNLDGSGWRLPTVEELLAIYSPDLTEGGADCGPYRCRISPLFRLTGFWFWSSTPNGSSEAFGVDLDDGNQGSAHVSSTFGLRALCARHRP